MPGKFLNVTGSVMPVRIQHRRNLSWQGALQVQLAGDAWYFGKKHEKPTIGDPIRPVEIADIARANRLLYAASALGMIVFNGIKIILLLLLL